VRGARGSRRKKVDAKGREKKIYHFPFLSLRNLCFLRAYGSVAELAFLAILEGFPLQTMPNIQYPISNGQF
jgi:hypothetical protein